MSLLLSYALWRTLPETTTAKQRYQLHEYAKHSMVTCFKTQSRHQPSPNEGALHTTDTILHNVEEEKKERSV